MRNLTGEIHAILKNLGAYWITRKPLRSEIPGLGEITYSAGVSPSPWPRTAGMG